MPQSSSRFGEGKEKGKMLPFGQNITCIAAGIISETRATP